MKQQSINARADAALVAPPRPARRVLQRKCGCGKNTAGGGECGTCSRKGKSLQRQAEGAAHDPSNAPDSVHQVLASSGRPLDAATRSFMEPRFGQDFSHVRVHTDSRAHDSARAVGAMAYTVGRDVIFGAGQYAPGTGDGRRLLAHELAHVVQQGGSAPVMQSKEQSTSRGDGGAHQGGQHEVEGTAAPARYGGGTLSIGRPGDSYEREADSVAEAVLQSSSPRPVRGATAPGLVQRTTAPLLQRKLVVNPTDMVPMAAGLTGTPTPLTIGIQSLLGDACPDGKFKVDSKTGVVSPGNSRFCEWHPPFMPDVLEADVSSTPVGCRCLCDTVNDTRTATIAFKASTLGTSPGSTPGPGPGQGGVKTDSTVSVDPRIQIQNLVGGKWVDVPFYLVLSHELCGHALPKLKGTHVARGATPPGGTPPQEQHAVDVERAMAAEHNPPLPRRSDDYSGGARVKP